MILEYRKKVVRAVKYFGGGNSQKENFVELESPRNVYEIIKASYCCGKMDGYTGEYLGIVDGEFGYRRSISHDCREDENYVDRFDFCPFCGEKIELIERPTVHVRPIYEEREVDAQYIITKKEKQRVVVGLEIEFDQHLGDTNLINEGVGK